ncbi:hypothetical protein BJ546DRAFT_1059498 [Cryomyces antarcticus]
MRLAAYAGTSVGLAAAVVLRAFHQRPNFYSASVYLSQSNACLGILANLALLCTAGFFYGLQRLFYGPLRLIETEQLYDKAWFAVTETCLAMTIFRDEVGGWFLVMFVGLLAGKVWGWIGEGRVEFLEQQPPANPRLFHTRLMASLVMSVLFDTFVLEYCSKTVLEQARPGMMVMFAFEFAVLAITSLSTLIRYLISLREILIIRQQTQVKIAERRAEIRAARAAAQRLTEAGNSDQTPMPVADLPREEDVDGTDIEVPGWEEKGRWTFVLDLVTDFVKLVVYVGFFFVLMVFQGLPIHILRDVFMTARSFFKRINDFIAYHNATRDMNTRYPDATAEELGNDNTCIVCREEMTAWQQPIAQPNAQPDAAGQAPPQGRPMEERLRPKKLPCGHILHLGCLKSWLERQQVCPTCRRSVLSPGPTTRVSPGNPGPGQNGAAQRVNPFARLVPPNPNEAHANNPGPGRNRLRILNLGFIRIGFAAAAQDQLPRIRQQIRNDQGATRSRRRERANSAATQVQLMQIEQQIMQDIASLNLAQEQLTRVRALEGELARLRALQLNPSPTPVSASATAPGPGPGPGPVFGMAGQMPLPPQVGQQPLPPFTQQQMMPGFHPFHGQMPVQAYMQPQAFVPHIQQPLMGAGHQGLPPGMTLPEGWTVLPLQRLGQGVQVAQNATTFPGLSGGMTSESVTDTTAATAQQPGIGSAAASATPSSAQASSTPAANNSTARIEPEDLQSAPSALNVDPTALTVSTDPAPQSQAISNTPTWDFGSAARTEDQEASNADDSRVPPGASPSPQYKSSATTEEPAADNGRARGVTVEDVHDQDN